MAKQIIKFISSKEALEMLRSGGLNALQSKVKKNLESILN